MKIQITMISGKKYIFDNLKYNNLDEWIRGNFDSNGAWIKLDPKFDFVIRIDNIETIAAIKGSDKEEIKK